MRLVQFGILALLTLATVSCGVQLEPAPQTLEEQASAVRTLDGIYTLNFATAENRKIYIGESPETIDWENPITTSDERTIIFDNLKTESRLFFGIENEKSERIILSERRIPLKKQPNFRDIGGLPTADGRRVKWGLIYRSGKLSKLNNSDLDYFANLGIEKVYDFRNNIEVEEDPDRYPEEVAIDYIRLPIGDPAGEEYEELVRQLRKGELEGAEMKARFEEIMASFADTLAEDFNPLVQDLIDNQGQTPIMYHCSGGKDRTGFATAIILASLGVEREVIFDEYLMSNYYRYDLNRRNLRLARLIGIKQEPLQYALVVYEDYLKAAFEIIDERYDGMDNYLEEKFGLTPEIRTKLKEAYTVQVQ